MYGLKIYSKKKIKHKLDKSNAKKFEYQWGLLIDFPEDLAKEEERSWKVAWVGLIIKDYYTTKEDKKHVSHDISEGIGIYSGGDDETKKHFCTILPGDVIIVRVWCIDLSEDGTIHLEFFKNDMEEKIQQFSFHPRQYAQYKQDEHMKKVITLIPMLEVFPLGHPFDFDELDDNEITPKMQKYSYQYATIECTSFEDAYKF